MQAWSARLVTCAWARKIFKRFAGRWAVGHFVWLLCIGNAACVIIPRYAESMPDGLARLPHRFEENTP